MKSQTEIIKEIKTKEEELNLLLLELGKAIYAESLFSTVDLDFSKLDVKEKPLTTYEIDGYDLIKDCSELIGAQDITLVYRKKDGSIREFYNVQIPMEWNTEKNSNYISILEIVNNEKLLKKLFKKSILKLSYMK